MDFLRTLKKRKPKKHAPSRVNVAALTRDKPKSRGIRIKRRGTTLNLASCFALFLGLAVVTQRQTEDYYIYQDPNGELVISNKQPPPESKIIKQLPGVTDREVHKPKNPVKRSQTDRQKAHRSPPRTNRASATRAYNNSFKPVANCIPGPNLRRPTPALHVKGEPVWLAT